MEQNSQLRKQVSDLMTQQQQQVSNHANLEQNLALTKETVNALEQKIKQDMGAMVDLFNQTRDLRSELSEKEENLAQLSGDIKDLTAKYNTVTSEREEVREQNSLQEMKLQDLKEEVGKMLTSSRIEVELLQDEALYATEEVERLTKVLDEQNGLLQCFQEQANQKDATIQNLQQQVKKQEDSIEKVTQNGGFNPLLEGTATPKSLLRTPCTPRSFIADQELESCHSSMVTMEILLMEHKAERASKNEEIQRLKTRLSDIEGMLNEFYRNHKQLEQNENTNGEQMNETIKQAMLRELQEERAEKRTLTQKLSKALKRLQAEESMFAQSQTSVQELTSQLRDRCLELRVLSLKEQEQERLLNEVEVLRKQVDHLSEENGKLVGHKNPKQRIEYLVRLKKENSKLQEDNEMLRSEMSLLRDV